MFAIRRVAATSLAVASLLLVAAAPASAHVHGITPLRCTPAVDNTETTGANGTNDTPASATQGGPISGVIPITMGGNVPLLGGGFNAAVC
jgi:hypothetical protein